MFEMCNEIYPGSNEWVCVAYKGHAEGKHKFWPKECPECLVLGGNAEFDWKALQELRKDSKY